MVGGVGDIGLDVVHTDDIAQWYLPIVACDDTFAGSNTGDKTMTTYNRSTRPQEYHSADASACEFSS